MGAAGWLTVQQCNVEYCGGTKPTDGCSECAVAAVLPPLPAPVTVRNRWHTGVPRRFRVSPLTIRVQSVCDLCPSSFAIVVPSVSIVVQSSLVYVGAPSAFCFALYHIISLDRIISLGSFRAHWAHWVHSGLIFHWVQHGSLGSLGSTGFIGAHKIQCKDERSGALQYISIGVQSCAIIIPSWCHRVHVLSIRSKALLSPSYANVQKITSRQSSIHVSQCRFQSPATSRIGGTTAPGVRSDIDLTLGPDLPVTGPIHPWPIDLESPLSSKPYYPLAPFIH